MKKTLIALAIAATAASSVNAAQIYKSDSNTIDFYGQLRQYVVSDGSYNKISDGSRAGFKFSHSLNATTDLLGHIEFNAHDSFKGRYSYVGISNADYGTLTVGKQDIVFDEVWGVENSYANGGNSVLPESAGGNMTWNPDAMVRYAISSDAGWLKADYVNDQSKTNARSAEAFVGTSFGNVEVYGGAGYADNDTGAYDVLTGDSLVHAMATVNYANDTVSFGATYWYMSVDSVAGVDGADLDTNSLAVAGSYKVSDVTTAYAEWEYITDYQAEGNDFNQVNVGAKTYLTPKFMAFAEVAFQSDDNEADSDNVIYGTGVRYYW